MKQAKEVKIRNEDILYALDKELEVNPEITAEGRQLIRKLKKEIAKRS